MENIALISISSEEFFNSVRQIVKEELQNKSNELIQDKLYSPKEACKLFEPSISRPTLESISKKGLLNKYHFGGKIFFKYSELMGALKSYRKYSHISQDYTISKSQRVKNRKNNVTEKLTDGYVKQRIKMQAKGILLPKEIPGQLVETKRASIKLKREIKTQK